MGRRHPGVGNADGVPKQRGDPHRLPCGSAAVAATPATTSHVLLERAPALGADGVAVRIAARHPALAAQRLHLLTEDVGAHLVGLADDVGESLVVAVVEAHVAAYVNPFVHLQVAHPPIVGVPR